MTSILIIRPGALGDAVLTLPLISALRAHGAKDIIVLGTPASWRFLAPGGIEIRDLDARPWLPLFGGAAALASGAQAVLRRTGPALVLLGAQGEAVADRLHAAGVASVAAVAPPRQDARAATGSEAAPSTIMSAPWPPIDAHAAARLVAALDALGITSRAGAWPPVPGAAADDPLLRPTRRERERALAEIGLAAVPRAGLLVVHPGSGNAAKCWPAERFAALASAARELWGVEPVFVAGPADEAAWQALAAALPAGAAPRVLRNRPLRVLLALLAQARAYVGNDSGVSHLAARAAPTLALFGPTDPRVWHPLGRRVAVLAAAAGDLRALSIDRVLAALGALL